jgi:uncharacterized protein (DUF2267 family)
MSHFDDWWAEEPRRSPAAYAVELARDRFWRDEQRRLIGTHPDFPEVLMLFDLSDELAHGLVLILSRLPEERREPFAEVFFDEHGGGDEAISNDPRRRLAAAARVALLIVDLAVDELRTERIADLLAGAAQGDDLTRTPVTAVLDLQQAIARVRLDVGLEDPSDPRAAASLAVAEVLNPAGDAVALKAVVARAAWAAVESWESPRALAFLLQLADALGSSS